uniref:Uncharacterized protein n=1 Tax=viral metagenome TaxID=1070528 RepID=A0A6M3IIU5_9ZZZZ
MPDDIEVTEPIEEESQPDSEAVVEGAGDELTDTLEPEPVDDEAAEEEAFLSDDDETPEDQPEAEPEDEQEEGEEDDLGLDEDDLRGKELLEQEQKAEEDRKARTEEAERQRRAREQAQLDTRGAPPIDERTAKIYRDVVPDTMIPDTVEIDGQSLDLKGYLTDFPESKVLSAMAADRVVIELVKQGFLMTAEQHQQALQEAENRMYDHIFSERVMEDVPKAFEISESAEFKAWQKTAKPGTQALFRSLNPRDHVRGFKKFMAEQGLADATVKKTAKTNTARARKAKHDAIHSTTLKSRKQPSKTSLTPEEEMAEGFYSDD